MKKIIDIIKKNSKYKSLSFIFLLPIVLFIVYALYYSFTHWWKIVSPLGLLFLYLSIAFILLSGTWKMYKTEGIIEALKFFLSLIAAFVIYYWWDPYGKFFIIFMFAMAALAIIFNGFWEIIKFPLKVFNEEFNYKEPSIPRVIYFYFIPIHIITCIFALFKWYFSEFNTFWESAKELFFAFCPIVNIFYASDIWLSLYIFIKEYLFS